MAEENNYPTDFDTWSDSARQAYLALLERTIAAESRLDQQPAPADVISKPDAAADMVTWRTLLFKTLSDLAATATSTLDIETILNAITRLTTKVVDATSAYVCDWDNDDKLTTVLAEFVSVKASDKERKSDLGVTYEMGEEYASQLYAEQGYWVSHIDDPAVPQDEREEMEEFGAQSILYVPLRVKTEVIGFIEVWESRFRREFTEKEIQLVQAIAHQAASVVRNAQLHQSLAESEARYRMLINTMREGVVQYDNDGIIVYVNDRFCQMLQSSSERLLGQSYHELLSALLTHSTETMDEFFADGSHEAQLHLDINNYIWVQLSQAAMTDRHQRRVGSVAVFTDITKRKEVSEQRLQLQLEQERIQLLAEFIQNASHEFYTPLSVIRTSLYLLSKPEKADIHPEYLDKIANQIASISQLVKALVSMTSLDSITQVTITPTYVKQLIRSAMHRVEDEAHRKQQTLDYDITEDGLFALVSAEMLLTALTNVIENAVRYTPEGGTIHISAERDGAFVRLRVADTGEGIGDEAVHRVFERFFREDEAHSTRGFGLGLSIAKRIVELHGGTIGIEGTSADGTVFSMLIPAAPPQLSTADEN